MTTAGHGTPSTRTAWGSHLYNPLLLGIANIGARALPYQQKLNIIKYKTAVMGFLVRCSLEVEAKSNDCCAKDFYLHGESI